VNHMHRRTQDFTMEGVHVVGAGPGGLGDGSPLIRSRGKAPVGGLGDEIPHKLKQNVKLASNNVFLDKILDSMNI